MTWRPADAEDATQEILIRVVTDYRGPEASMLAQEVRLSCTQAMLQCLERGERIAFLLSDVFELSSADAATVTPSGRGVAEAAAQLHRLHDAAAVMRGVPDYAAPQAKVDAIAALLHSRRFPLLE